jgi:hypothetical protein
MPDDSPDDRRMTYVELGIARGISTKSAERLARRRKWHRVPGNDGMARVIVPAGEDRRAPDRQPGRQGGRQEGHQGSHPAPDIGEVVRDAIREVITPLTAQIEAERARAERAEKRIIELDARIAELLARRWWAPWRR